MRTCRFVTFHYKESRMKNVLLSLVAFLLLASSAGAQQIGQAQIADGPIVIGEGSYSTKGGPLAVDVTVLNATTGDIIDTITKDDFRAQLTKYNPATGRWDLKIDVYIYILKHTKPVAEGDVLLFIADGKQVSLKKVRKYTIYGIYTIWDLVNVQ